MFIPCYLHPCLWLWVSSILSRSGYWAKPTDVPLPKAKHPDANNFSDLSVSYRQQAACQTTSSMRLPNLFYVLHHYFPVTVDVCNPLEANSSDASFEQPLSRKFVLLCFLPSGIHIFFVLTETETSHRNISQKHLNLTETSKQFHIRGEAASLYSQRGSFHLAMS